MAKPTHPARREPVALSLLGLSLLAAAAAATLLLTGHPVAGGAAALVAASAQFAVVPAPGRVSFLQGTASPLCDAAVLAPLAWAERFDDRTVAALALIALGTTLVACYERARSDALGYRVTQTRPVRLLRQALPAAGVIAGGAWLTGSLWAVLCVAGLLLVVRAANVVLQERVAVRPEGST